MVQAVMRAMGGWDGERQTKLCSLARPPLTSCRAAWFLAGQGPKLVRGQRVGDPCSTNC